ncbi:unnamed protein product, partial [Mesorhabditis belari]|uniref:Cyclic nucleotide-binding domain-containing protein n=1 Tax=Mesorhabditis belari TaxID=2138241 RepID=A0AAF3ES72_9BILA
MAIRETLKQVKAASKLRKLTGGILLARKWLLHEKQRHDHQADELNTKRVFDINLREPPEKGKRSWIRRIVFWSFDETSTFFYYWSMIIFLGCFYNLATIAVMTFEVLLENHFRNWMIGNFVFDSLYFVDLLILTRKEFIKDGIRERRIFALLVFRLKSPQFYLDTLSLLPTDLFLFHSQMLSIVRVNRLLKVYRVLEFYTLTEIRTNLPNLFHLFKLVFLCLVIFHWNASLYYFLSTIFGLETGHIESWIFSYDKVPDPIFVTCENDYRCPPNEHHPLSDYEEWTNFSMQCERTMEIWSNRSFPMKFSNFSKQYSLSFYWSALTLVTLGEQPSPEHSFQNTFEILDTFLGLVIFAVILGDIGNMVQTMNLKKSEFEEVLDGTRSYMHRHKVHPALQNKIVRYLQYCWSEGQMSVDEQEIADFLPNRLYGHMSVHIHMETLRRVPLFADCDPTLLYEFILRLELQVYSPGDYICRKGEVGKEMYIVKSGFVEVVNEDGTKVFVRLGEGTVFGELSILNIPGNKNGDRRTANVRSAGYTNLYALKKEDLWEALRDYPDAKVSLLEKGKQILAKDNLLDESNVEQDNWDPDAPIEEKLALIKDEVEAFTKQLKEAEVMIQKSMISQKQRVGGLERLFAEAFEELLINKKKFGESFDASAEDSDE